MPEGPQAALLQPTPAARRRQGPRPPPTRGACSVIQHGGSGEVDFSRETVEGLLASGDFFWLDLDQPSGPGFVTVFPCGGGAPLASNLNYAAGQVVANVATSPVADGAVCVFTWAATHVIVDFSGYFT